LVNDQRDTQIPFCVFIKNKIKITILNPGLPWQKLRSTRRRISLPENWT
jgi:hypothetical protein